MAAVGGEVYRKQAQEPLSAAPAMDEPRRRLLLATLRGRLLCYAVRQADCGQAHGHKVWTHRARSAAAQMKRSSTQTLLLQDLMGVVGLQQLWTYDLVAPVFGAPAVDADTGIVVCGTSASSLLTVSSAGAPPAHCSCS